MAENALASNARGNSGSFLVSGKDRLDGFGKRLRKASMLAERPRLAVYFDGKRGGKARGYSWVIELSQVQLVLTTPRPRPLMVAHPS